MDVGGARRDRGRRPAPPGGGRQPRQDRRGDPALVLPGRRRDRDRRARTDPGRHHARCARGRDERSDGAPSRARRPAPGEVPRVRPAGDAGEQPPAGGCPRGGAVPHAIEGDRARSGRGPAGRDAGLRRARRAGRDGRDDGGHDPAGAGRVPGRRGPIPRAPVRRDRRVGPGRAGRRSLLGLHEPVDRVPRLVRGGQGPGHRQGGDGRGGGTPDRSGRRGGPQADRRRRVHLGGRDPRAGRGPAARGSGSDARVRRVDHRWGSGGAYHQRPGRLGGLHRIRGRVPQRGEASDPRRVGRDPRGSGSRSASRAPGRWRPGLGGCSGPISGSP